MKIDNINRLNKQVNSPRLEGKKENISKAEKTQPAASYESSKIQDKGHVYDRTSIERLKKESDNVYGQLKQMVEDMLTKQGKAFANLLPGDSVKIDEATRVGAKDLLGPDGPLGIEAMSDKIVDFAKAISGGDKGKLETLRGAIEKGFKEAERILGTLPDISQKTHARIMEKLDKWQEE